MKDITDKIDRIINEGNKFEAGSWVVQRRGSDNEWGMLVGQLKNGAWTVISKSDERVGGKATKKSTKGWYPAPELVDVKEVPPKIKQKVEQKIKELNIQV